MQRIELDNFRVFGTPARFDLTPVTVLTGKNNSGKSSLIKAFLVLADYLEQEDQTVLRLDGPRASRHRINNWKNLKNWDSADTENLILSYTQGEMQFTFEFEHGGYIESRKITLPPRLYRFRITVPGVDRMTLQSIGAGSGYQLDVSQKFIDYVAGSNEERVKFRESDNHKQQLTSLQNQLASINEAIQEADTSAKPLANFAKLLTERQNIEFSIANLEDLLAQAKFGAGIFFQVEVYLADISTRATISSLIQEALNEYMESHEEQFEEDRDEEDRDEEDDDEHLIPSEKEKLSDSTYPNYNFDYDELDADEEKDNLNIARQEHQEKKAQEATRHTYQFSREQEHRLLFQFRQAIENSLRFEMYHLGANRTYQARLYLMGTHHAEINTIAENFQRQGVFIDGAAEHFLSKWLEEFEVGELVSVELVDNVAIRIEISKGNKKVNLADLGFGAGQILAVLLQIAALIQQQESNGAEAMLLARIKPTLVLVEEPEANLHPKLQSMLAALFTETARDYGLQFILETHSEYFIRKLQLLVSAQQCPSEEIVLYYLEENSQRHITILPDGRLSELFGPGFFDEAGEETLALHRIQREAQRAKQQ